MGSRAGKGLGAIRGRPGGAIQGRFVGSEQTRPVLKNRMVSFSFTRKSVFTDDENKFLQDTNVRFSRCSLLHLFSCFQRFVYAFLGCHKLPKMEEGMEGRG